MNKDRIEQFLQVLEILIDTEKFENEIQKQNCFSTIELIRKELG